MKKIISVLTGIMIALSVIMPAAVFAAEENILELGKTVDFTPDTIGKISTEEYYFTPTVNNAYRFDGIYYDGMGQFTASYSIEDTEGNYLQGETFSDSAVQKNIKLYF